MPDSRPHIRLEELRAIEDRTFTGGGGGTYAREDYRRHSRKIFRQTQELRQTLEKALDKDLTPKRYIRVELPPDENVLTSQGEKLSTNILGTLVGSPKKNVGHFSTPQNSFDSVVEQIRTYQDSDQSVGKSKFAIIEKLSEIPPEEKVSANLRGIIAGGEDPGEVLISLFPDLNRDETATIKMAITSFLTTHNGEILSEYDGSAGRIFKARVPSARIDELAECFLAIQTVDPVEDFLVDSAVVGAAIEDTVTVQPNTSQAKVCIFDSGVIRNSRFFDDSIIAYEEPIGRPFNTTHGTFVASRIIYGNSLRDDISAGQLKPDVKILSVCMTSHDDIGNARPAVGDDFLRIIRDTVQRWHREIKVYNLSMNLRIRATGKPAVVTDDHIGPVAAELDNLSKKYGVLFVVTTGNYPMSPGDPTPTDDYPTYFNDEESRLCRPGEAMLALTVGSVADRENNGSMTRSKLPSPFTRRGPGFNEYRKPDLVAAGGNYAANWRHFDDLSVAGIDGTSGSISFGSGTSYAAPLISRLAAKIFEHVPNATPDLVRALLIHSAQLNGKGTIDDEVLLKLVGNGEPRTDFLLSSDRWTQHFVYSGVIGYRKIVKIPFYVPQALTNRTCNKKVRVQFTLSFSPETNRTLKAGYCKSHLRTKIYKRNANGSLYGTSSSDTEICIADRYSTIVRYDKEFSRELQHGDWELLIEQESRWVLSETDTPFAFVLTISDPQRDTNMDIYNAIQTEAPNRFEDMIPVRERLRV